MSRRLSIPFALLAMLVFSTVTSAAPVDGCYASASAATIKEDQPVTITIQCENVPVGNNVFGFQIGTVPTGSFDVAIAPTVYSSGSFSSLAIAELLAGPNLISGLYAVSRTNADVVTVEDFTLGSYLLTAEDNLTANGSIVITMTDADFILSSQSGESLSGWLRDVNDVTVTVTNIDLAWLSGSAVVRSDVNTIVNVDNLVLTLGDKSYSNTNLPSFTHTIPMDVTYQYQEAGTPAADGTLEISVVADLTGHLGCTNTINLGDTGAPTAVTTKIGVAGTITLKAGDATADGSIDIADSTLLGANFNTNPGGDQDINGDNVINVLDLVHVGRNYNSASGSCGTGA
jgi:hypothetical protein